MTILYLTIELKAMSEFFVYPEDMSDYEETTETYIISTNENQPEIKNTSLYKLVLNETKSFQNQINKEITKKTN